MAQEALNNVARHAQASSAEVRLSFNTGSIRLTVADDGRGFDVPESPAEMAPEGHYGLLGLHERAELIGGRLTILSKSNQGTTVIVSVPG
jgi:signal transduction histidine kinase